MPRLCAVGHGNLSCSVFVLWPRCSRPYDRSCSSRSVVPQQSQPLSSELVLFLRLAFRRVWVIGVGPGPNYLCHNVLLRFSYNLQEIRKLKTDRLKLYAKPQATFPLCQIVDIRGRINGVIGTFPYSSRVKINEISESLKLLGGATRHQTHAAVPISSVASLPDATSSPQDRLAAAMAPAAYLCSPAAVTLGHRVFFSPPCLAPAPPPPARVAVTAPPRRLLDLLFCASLRSAARTCNSMARLGLCRKPRFLFAGVPAATPCSVSQKL